MPYRATLPVRSKRGAVHERNRAAAKTALRSEFAGSLAEVIKKLEQPAFQSKLALIPTDTR